MATIRSRLAGMQVPISRIQSLATAAHEMLGDMGSIPDERHREIAEHVINFVDLIFDVAAQASAEAEAIEIDAGRQEGR